MYIIWTSWISLSVISEYWKIEYPGYLTIQDIILSMKSEARGPSVESWTRQLERPTWQLVKMVTKANTTQSNQLVIWVSWTCRSFGSDLPPAILSHGARRELRSLGHDSIHSFSETGEAAVASVGKDVGGKGGNGGRQLEKEEVGRRRGKTLLDA